jgi:type I restriction enzyme S subunit
VGACGALNLYDQDVWVTDNALVVKPRLPKFIHFLKLFFSTVRWSDLNSGSSQPLINQTIVRNLALRLPPLAEQDRIVAKVEDVLAKIDAARQRLAKVPALLKRFRQSVLAAACSGRLTAHWRGVDDEGDLPTGWERAHLDQILHPTRAAGYGVLQPGPDVPNGVPMVRVCDIENGTVLIDQLKHIARDIDAQYRRTRLQGGEVLVTLVGTIGRTAVAPPEAAGANIARAVAMLPLRPDVSAKYVQLALAEPFTNSVLGGLAREVARKTLNLGLLKEVQIPLPAPKEQSEIVRRVERLFKLADAAERRVAAASARADRIAAAVLAKAFRGELVPTEAELARREGREYEPASVLLERIRATRAQAPKATRRKKERARV